MNDVFDQFRKDRAENCIPGDQLRAYYDRTRDAAYLEKHKPQLGKLQLSQSGAQQDHKFKKPASKLSLTQTKLIPTIKKNSNSSHVKVTDTENQSPKDKLFPFNQSFVSEYEPVTRGIKRLSDQYSYLSSKYVRPLKQRRQQPSFDDRFSCKISPSNPSYVSSDRTDTASAYPENANQSFATTVATSSNSGYDEWDSSSADYGDPPDPSQAAQIDQLLTSVETPSCDPEDSGVVNNQSFTKCEHSSDDQLSNRPSVVSESGTWAASVRLQSKYAALPKVPFLKTKTTTTTKVLEHRLVRTLPTDGLFGSPVTTSVNHSSFITSGKAIELQKLLENPLNTTPTKMRFTKTYLLVLSSRKLLLRCGTLPPIPHNQQTSCLKPTSTSIQVPPPTSC